MHDLLPPGGLVRKLWPGEAEAYRDHLLRLDPESRRRRFSGAVGDDFIAQHARSIGEFGTVVYGFFLDGTLRGAAELRPAAPFAREAEAAFSVEQPWQSHGVGTVLLEHVLLAARNRGIVEARGEWITFPDPDDVLEPPYLKVVEKFLLAHPDAAMAATNRLLWQEGKYGLDLPVRDVLGELGFSMISQVDEPASFMLDGETVFVEVEGSTGSIGMNPHYRLRQRLEERIADGRRVHGIIVVNGERAQAPTARPQPIENSLRVAAESMRYCVVETADLYDALLDKLKGGGNSAAFCHALMETEGFYRKPASPVTGEAATTTDSIESK